MNEGVSGKAGAFCSLPHPESDSSFRGQKK